MPFEFAEPEILRQQGYVIDLLNHRYIQKTKTMTFPVCDAQRIGAFTGIFIYQKPPTLH